MDTQVEENRVRLVLVADQALFLASLGRFLASQQELEVVGECGSASETLAILNASPVDVILVDLDLRAERADDLILATLRAGYKGRFLGLATAAEAGTMAATINVGASGVFLKSENLDRLVQAIRLVASGAVWIDQRMIQLLADQLANRPQSDDRRSGSLTDREERVLLGILGGLTNRKIGGNLGLSESAVKGVVQQLFFRAGVRSRSQLVRMALEGSLGAIRDLRKAPNRTMAAGPSGCHGEQTADRH
jgi:DNA-binding NarL/FixJ family response regulator